MDFLNFESVCFFLMGFEFVFDLQFSFLGLRFFREFFHFSIFHFFHFSILHDAQQMLAKNPRFTRKRDE